MYENTNLRPQVSQSEGPVGEVVTAPDQSRLGLRFDPLMKTLMSFLRNAAKNYPTRGPAEAPLTGHLSTPSIQRYIRRHSSMD